MRGRSAYDYGPDMPNEELTNSYDSAGDKVISIRLSEEIRTEVESAAITTGLKTVDVYRLAIKRGVGILVDQLTSTTNTSEAV